MDNVNKKNIGLPSRYINALYELCDEAKNLKKITQDFEKFIKLVEDNKNLNNIKTKSFEGIVKKITKPNLFKPENDIKRINNNKSDQNK